jgi:hypothetical protein
MHPSASLRGRTSRSGEGSNWIDRSADERGNQEDGALGEHLTALQVVGLVAVMIASAGATTAAGNAEPEPSLPAGH